MQSFTLKFDNRNRTNGRTLRINLSNSLIIRTGKLRFSLELTGKVGVQNQVSRFSPILFSLKYSLLEEDDIFTAISLSLNFGSPELSLSLSQLSTLRKLSSFVLGGVVLSI